jgi:aerobic carbon-monoxide dehydrogenase medium subunit
VYPATFEYHAPTSLEETLAILGRYAGEAKVLAGGQSLVPAMKLRIAAPQALVDINRIESLDVLDEADGWLRIGALVRHKTCERSELLRGRYRVLSQTAPQISDPIVRNLGTVCGSLAHADPQGDWGAALLALGAEVVLVSTRGARTIAVNDFLQGPFLTAIQPDEVLTETRVPDPGARASGTYLKLERKVGDFATAAVAVHVSLDNGTVAGAGIALTGVGPRNTRATDAEQALAGAEPTDEAIRTAAELAPKAAEPWDDHRGSAQYKRNVVRVFTERGLRTAIEAARAA